VNKKKEILIFIVFLVLITLAGIFLKLPLFMPTSTGEKQSDMVAGLVIQFRAATTEPEAKNILDDCNLPAYKFEYNIINTPGYYIIVNKNKANDIRDELRKRPDWTDSIFPDIDKGDYYIITVTEQAIQDKNFLEILEKNNIKLEKFVWCRAQFGEHPMSGISKERADELKSELEMNKKVFLVQFETIFS
jgi:predicted small lipoprotein YifL